MSAEEQTETVAVVGMHVRVPGASSAQAFWSNLAGDVGSIARFTEEELLAWGAPADVVGDKNFVPARGLIEEADCFDGAFFGLSDAESALIDPQQRILLEAAWAAVEDAGHDPKRLTGRLGVFAGTGPNHYWRAIERSREARVAGELQVQIANSADSVATRIAYMLDARGPAMTVQSACSTSLVCVHLACQSLLTHEADIMLAGAAVVGPADRRGQVYQPGGIASSDGHCRPFDSMASGTVFSDGVVMVALKRLSDAIRDGNQVYGVIAGSAVANDGGAKAGFTAPGITGQVDTIVTALAVAGVLPRDIDVIEAHGTGTPLGDPIELAALSEAYAGARERPIVLTAVKGNIGHLDVAAGAAGLVKMLLAMKNERIPAIHHLSMPNPRLAVQEEQFDLAAHIRPWPKPLGRPRRAGVSSFGIGGTNVHVILEEPPEAAAVSPVASGPALLPLSARSEEALWALCDRLAVHLSDTPQHLGDVARTLRVGRSMFPWRTHVVAGDSRSAAARLQALAQERPHVTPAAKRVGPVLLFPGQGSQRPDMARGLYENDPLVRDLVDQGVELAREPLGRDLRDTVYGDGDGDREVRGRDLDDTAIAQPALYIVQYALGRALIERGVQPLAVLGHSVGEFAAAALAGIFSFEDGLSLVVARGREMARASDGGMLAVLSSPDRVLRFLTSNVVVAAVNGPDVLVLSGPRNELATIERALRSTGIISRPVATSHAFHSPSMEQASKLLASAFKDVELSAPTMPVISSMTGELLEASEATSPEYWCSQILRPVQFAGAVDTAVQLGATAWVEVGPGRALRPLIESNPVAEGAQLFSVAEHPERLDGVLATIGGLWRLGHTELDNALPNEGSETVSLPTYPFARRRHHVPYEGTPALQAREEVRPNHSGDASVPVQAASIGAVGDEIDQIWTEVLGSPPASPTIDFFQVGGHSLAALRLIARIREKWGIEVGLDEFFDSPSPKALRERVSTAETVKAGRLSVGLPTLAPSRSTAADDRDTDEPGHPAMTAGPTMRRSRGIPAISIYFFSAESEPETDAYGMITAAAQLADKLNFEAVWSPERHFHQFGAPFPNPSVLSAALAAVTNRVHLRAGSVVLPLHHPLRIAEEWGMVDRISRGRAGVSFAPGFHPLDFILAPDRFADRRENIVERIEHIRSLWRGSPHRGMSGGGAAAEVSAFPGAYRDEIPVWLTASASEESFRMAGAAGYRLLTAMLTLSPEQLADRLEVYRSARASVGLDPADGHITLMVHAYVGENNVDVRELCRPAFYQYLTRHTELVDSEIQALGGGTTLANARASDRDAILRRSYEDFYDRRSLMGSQLEVSTKLQQFARMGITEVAGLIDFGLAQEPVLRGLERLGQAANDAALAWRTAAEG